MGSTTLFEAPHFDEAKARRRKMLLLAIVSVIIVVCVVLYIFRNWPEERVVEHFFTALQHKDFETAYGIWMADPQWKQHPQQHSQYPFDDFVKDWGPSGEWGIIKSFHVDGTAVPKDGSGVVVVVTVNDITGRKANIWVEKKDKSLTFSPLETCDTGRPCT